MFVLCQKEKPVSGGWDATVHICEAFTYLHISGPETKHRHLCISSNRDRLGFYAQFQIMFGPVYVVPVVPLSFPNGLHQLSFFPRITSLKENIICHKIFDLILSSATALSKNILFSQISLLFWSPFPPSFSQPFRLSTFYLPILQKLSFCQNLFLLLSSNIFNLPLVICAIIFSLPLLLHIWFCIIYFVCSLFYLFCF